MSKIRLPPGRSDPKDHPLNRMGDATGYIIVMHIRYTYMYMHYTCVGGNFKQLPAVRGVAYAVKFKVVLLSSVLLTVLTGYCDIICSYYFSEHVLLIAPAYLPHYPQDCDFK